MDPKELLAMLAGHHNDAPKTFSSSKAEQHVRVLRMVGPMLAPTPNPFVVGDVVTWKPGLSNRRIPAKNQPAVVTKIYDEPIFDEAKESGSGYFREPLSMVLAVWDEDDNSVMEFHYDHRRFELFEQSDTNILPFNK